MEWRELGDEGDFPAWMARLDGKSGVYAIRERGLLGNEIVYVGESHTGNLRKTVQRHFQQWHRRKKFWLGAYAPAQTDPGHTYRRGRCELAYELATPERALKLQSDWIARLKPRDNRAGVDEEVPF